MAKPTRTIKVFCDTADQKKLAGKYELIEHYESFALLRVTPAHARAIARRLPAEDVTDQYKIKIGRRTINTNKPRIDTDGKLRAHAAYKNVKKLSPGKHHYLVQFIGPIKRSWLTRLKKLGAEPRTPFSGFTYVVRASAAVIKLVAGEPCVRWTGHLSHADRVHVSTSSRALPRTRTVKGVYMVEFFDRDDMKRAATAIGRLGAKVLSSDAKARLMSVQLDPTGSKLAGLIRGISAIHGIRSIRKRSLKRSSNDVAAGIMNAGRSLSAPLGLSGAGEIVAVCDTGLDSGTAQNIHPDFDGRIVAIKSYPITPSLSPFVTNPGGNDGAADFDSGHGTHVAGSAVGSGVASVQTAGSAHPIRGLAHRARLVFQAVEQEMRWKNIQDYFDYGRYLLAGIPDDVTTLFTYAYNKGARVHSNSWGGGEPGEYDAQSRQLDEFVWRKKDFCIVVAAGNDGTDFDGDGRINTMSVTSPATAKNCITVGASESLRPGFNAETYGSWWPGDYPAPPYKNAPMANGPSQVVAFSSRGPTEDGRVKPDIVAPGTFILSARSRMLSRCQTGWAPHPADGRYFFMGGTSMATPLVSGAVAVLREFFRVWVGYDKPTAALLKAALIAGARKLPGVSPAARVFDHHQGYGRVDLDAIIAPPAPTRVYFYDDPSGLHTGQSDAFEIDVRSSTRPLRVAMAYSDFPGDALVNNMNLILTAPSGKVSVGNGQPGGTLAPDATNNTEAIILKNPARGVWTLRVAASSIPQGPQPYAFVVSGNVRM